MRALITGVNGQDGSYLAEYLLSRGYEVHGTIRHTKLAAPDGVVLHYADLRDDVSLEKVIRKVQPNELYNLAGQVFVPTSWLYPAQTFDVNTNGLARILQLVEVMSPHTRVYQASTSEMFGNHASAMGGDVLLNEASQMHPVSPYGVSKLAGHHLIDVYRKHGVYAVSGILFNHESPRRGLEMVTRKITRHVAGWKLGLHRKQLELGNIGARRDWGFAGDYVRAMHAMLQQDYASDYVIGTGEAYSVKEFLQLAIDAAGLEWQEYKELVRSNQLHLLRNNELTTLIADARKAQSNLKWKPEVHMLQLVNMMVKADINELSADPRLVNV